MSADQQDPRPHAYHMWGTHGGFFLTNHTLMGQAFDFVQRALDESPELVFTMEIEAETVALTAPGLEITETNLEGKPLRSLGTGRGELEVGPMQIKTIRLSTT